MAEPKKLPSGNWRIRICYLDEKGKQVRKSFTAETKQEARHMADLFMNERNHNKKIENKTIKGSAEKALPFLFSFFVGFFALIYCFSILDMIE